MFDIVAVGELLIDFTPGGISAQGAALFEMNPGGAPGNVLVLAAKLNKKTALISKVGNDSFGRFLTDVMVSKGVETRGVLSTEEAKTTLAFVHLDKNGDRSFSFYRNPGADMLLDKSEIDMDLVGNCRIFHFGTVSMTHNPSREATLFGVKAAKEHGALISFDPNLRPPLWNSLEEAKSMILEGLRYANILKVSNEELEFITGIKELDKGTDFISGKYGTDAILVTLGPAGCYFKIGRNMGILPAYDVRTIDTTGAGDAFLGAFLHQVLENGRSVSVLSRDEIENMVDFANAAGSLATVRKGAIPAMPSLEEITECRMKSLKLTGK